ncbi:MAG: hypothetical protein CH6_0387 [Candidatus Kapaibacterium sp.]|nr:MAG: hypothetical protein CH6_0387 [Candidatus Kapabacteria bacterium]
MNLYEGILFNRKDMLSPFKCDVSRCRGACCFIEGELGAPLKAKELEIIDNVLPEVWDLIPDKSKEIVKTSGWYIKTDGKYYTNVVNRKECVFAFFENGIARCSFERRYFEGKIKFRKPISCHLFPLREYSFFFTELVYVKIPECETARETGFAEDIPLVLSLKEALIRRFGERWFSNLLEKELGITNIGVDKTGGAK